MIRVQDSFRVKRSGGAIVSMVKEHYLRSDVPCCSKLCSECTQRDAAVLLPDDVTHYLIPDCQILKNFLEVFEAAELKGIIFLQTVVNFLQFYGGRRLYQRFRNLVKLPEKGCAVFSNEFHQGCYVKRTREETLEQWQNRSIFTAAKWLNTHLSGKISIVIVTENVEFLDTYRDHTIGLFVLTLKDYLGTFWPSLTNVSSLYESMVESLKEQGMIGKGTREYFDYLPTEVLQAGIQSGKLLKGYLRVSKHNSMNEAVVQVSRSNNSSKDSDLSDILIPGQSCRNRAIHGDLVVVELLPKDQWRSKANILANGGEDQQKDVPSDRNSAVPTGSVVGILQRNTRQYVACIPEDNVAIGREVSEKILVVPWDFRIPKIRIATRKAEKLKNERILVRVDSWEIDSFYPNGHFIKSIGQIGQLETEIKAILAEHELDIDPSFSQGIQQEMPTNCPEKPFRIEDYELTYRRDLRKSHLIFSIDPVGCEDVDDTLSIRKLKKGKIELGVHIADVTHFVKSNSLTDIEASRRSTTVYLADRRFDMLPAILSADLCSLISGVDRYAVSVIWKFDQNYQVLDVWYGRTIIKSSYKLFYEAAQLIADGMLSANNITDTVPEMSTMDDTTRLEKFDQLKEAVISLMEIARHFKKARTQSGAVELEGSEVQIEATDGNVKELTPKKVLEIHETVAECMIFANHWVAKKIEEAFPNNALLRHHPVPKQEFFSDLKDCASAKGFTLNTSSNSSLAESLNQCVDPQDPEFNKILRSLATQAMSVAAYFSTGSLKRDQFFHYGLALERYTHFTSPIRRYADIIVHRLLLMAVDAKHCQSDLLKNESLEQLCNHINIKHREAQNAQRDSVELFQSIYFKDHNDDDSSVVEAMVFKLKANGVLVTIPRYGVKGAVFLKDKEGLVATPTWDDRVEFGPGSLTQTDGKLIINHACGETVIQLLDKIQVRIAPNFQRAHLPSLRLELLSLRTSSISLEPKSLDSENLGQKELFKMVRAEEEEKGRKLTLGDNLNHSDEFTGAFAQTHPELSLYSLFQNFRKTAMLLE